MDNGCPIASHIFRPLPVVRPSGSLSFRGIERFVVIDTTASPGREAPRLEPASISTTFCCDKQWPEDDGGNETWLKHEGEVQKLVAGGAVPNVTLSGTSQWSNANSDPVAAIGAQREKILTTVGETPKTLVVSEPVWSVLRCHPKIVNHFAGAAMLSLEQLKSILEVEDFFVALSDIWNRDALLCYVPPKLAHEAMALGYTFRWKSQYDVKLVEPKAGFYWFNASG